MAGEGLLAHPDIVTARALAPLRLLLGLGLPKFAMGVPAYFHKGREHAEEIAVARREFEFDLVVHDSCVEMGSVILEIRNVAPLAV